ncbi:MAG: type I restriction enzyme HsdR N-terminal domain-containing protein [Saprospiraceae bacterium]|nr:type I restriction enzyme HsdR N-terminal domain-containing protein [Saprospiraceae bacterium]MCF8248456.1 type I restriction enzyme HsdR N-terminal domain-containing protein [Saprospiraceae bacterium]MCF8283202.1 type I restriction enzyme HsdR N-terminal domain-containing protein [Bacteroidales bacterium]MCF8309984.1 type I restriction enzyme HsdR N-terminal domain-containing protein [Saprospiraceae bacterium]MCF8438685.1 type I restriction enzyme HsdR N-terminal domain-containing protein [
MQLSIDLLKFQSSLELMKQDGQVFIFDPIRKKHLVQTPEEVVRQLFLAYLIQEKNYPKNRIRTEKELTVNELTKRCDILAYDWEMRPHLLVECKAPNVPITEATLRQVAAYNQPLRVKYLVLTNGLTNWCCELDYLNASWEFLSGIPDFPTPSSK